MPAKLVNSALLLGVILMTGYLLAQGRAVLIPIAVSVIVWYLLNALARAYGRIQLGTHAPPRWFCLAAAILSALVAALFLVEIVSSSISAVKDAAPQYQENLERLVAQISTRLGFDDVPTTAQFVERIDLPTLTAKLAGSAASFTLTFVIVVFYVAFLLIEQQSFEQKFQAMFPDRERQNRLMSILVQIQREIQKYIWIKFVMGLLTGGVTFIVLVAVGVDFATLWSFVIFLLSFIPTVGTLLGIVFPAIVTLLQFDTITPFLIVAASLGSAQLLLNNWVEPRFMGKSLNLSAFVILVGLAVSGAIWGIIGAVLCVPIMVIATIILSHFPKTRAIAIALSSDGNVTTAMPE